MLTGEKQLTRPCSVLCPTRCGISLRMCAVVSSSSELTHAHWGDRYEKQDVSKRHHWQRWKTCRFKCIFLSVHFNHIKIIITIISIIGGSSSVNIR